MSILILCGPLVSCGLAVNLAVRGRDRQGWSSRVGVAETQGPCWRSVAPASDPLLVIAQADSHYQFCPTEAVPLGRHLGNSAQSPRFTQLTSHSREVRRSRLVVRVCRIWPRVEGTLVPSVRYRRGD